jgi:hypothetical protein
MTICAAAPAYGRVNSPIISSEKKAGPTLKVKKIDAPNHMAALATPTNRKNPITRSG